MTEAKAIYFFGGLDERVFRSAAGPSYPIFVPTLSAMNFRFMAPADTTTLAVQWWLLAVGFVTAAAGLLRRLAPPAVTWLLLVTALPIPEFDRRLLERTADWPLDILFAVSALALLSWIVSGESWRLWCTAWPWRLCWRPNARDSSSRCASSSQGSPRQAGAGARCGSAC
jgi:hypothetical protein